MPEPQSELKEIRVAFLVNNQQPDLRPISMQTSITSIIQEFIEKYKLQGTVEDYAFEYQKTDKLKDYKIVTEKEKAEMNGKVVQLSDHPRVATERMLNKINDVTTESKELETLLQELRDKSVDPTFGAVFVSKGGLQILMKGVTAKFRVPELGLVLPAIFSLLEHEASDNEGEGELTQPDEDFIRQLADLTSKKISAVVIKFALKILCLFVKEDKARDVIEQKVKLSSLIDLLSHNDSSIQRESLGLINSLLDCVDLENKKLMIKEIQERPARNIILDNLLTKDKEILDKESNHQMGHQLYLLQYHMFSLLQVRLHTKLPPQDNNSLQKIKDLRSAAFDTGSPGIKNQSKFAQDYTKLGFKNIKDPSEDFQTTPPGILALDCMDHFAKQHQEKYMKVVLENSCRQDNHECPFAESSCELVSMLVDIIGVGKDPIPNYTKYHKMFFKVEHPFEEFYSYCIVIFNKTWRDMRATRLDFPKVLDVVREQLETSLNTRPDTLDQFKSNVRNYAEISKKWQADAKNREAWEASKPVAELREHLQGEIEELIRQQRQNFMVEGTRFNRMKKTGELVRTQFKYVKLHTNHKTIYVGDWTNDKTVPTIEDLEPRLYVADIKEINTGAECLFIKDYKSQFKEQFTKLAFSLVGENNDPLLDLVAPDEKTYNYWVDGIHTLMRRSMSSDDYKKEKDILTNMEIKLRLLDLEGVDLPQEAPPIPPLPTDFNFASC